MSELNLDDELVQDYLAECREHLATIEADLLAIEQAGEAIDEQLVNRVFRAAHSIKGGAGFFDLVKIRELAHKTENALDLVRSRHMVPTPEIVSILLMAFDKLPDLVQHHRESNQADIRDFVDALNGLTAAHLPADQKQSVIEAVAVPVSPEASRYSGLGFRSESGAPGRQVHLSDRIRSDPRHPAARQDALEVLKSLIECGTILETVFDLDSAGTLDDEPSNRLLLEVLYATVLEPDLIGQVVEVPPERIRAIEKNGVVRPLAEPAAPVPPAASIPSPLPPPRRPRLPSHRPRPPPCRRKTAQKPRQLRRLPRRRPPSGSMYRCWIR